MPRTSTRKSASKKSSTVQTSDVEVARPARRKATKNEFRKIDKIFDLYSNKSSGVIDPEGIEALCLDMGMDYTDIRILMLAWKIKAEKQGFFTQDEWRRGLKDLKVDTLNNLKKALPELEKEVWRPPNFVDFYSYAFKYCLTEVNQKTVDIESICVLLELVLGSQFRPQIDSIIIYLKIQNEYRAINLDQWMGFLRFCNEISYPDLQNYDPNESWPLILDNFVEWISENNRSITN